MIQGVIFDMDGLMFDTERLWLPLWAPACAALGMPEPTEEFILGARGLAGVNMVRHIEKSFPGFAGQPLLEAIWALGAERFAKGVPVKPGLPELLAYLEEQNIPRIVASSSSRAMVENNLRTTGTARYFTQCISGDDVQRSKPDPEVFLKAAAALGVPPERCLVLEDSFNGVRAGHAAGCVTVMVPDLAQPDEEMRSLYHTCCTDLHEVKALLEQGAL